MSKVTAVTGKTIKTKLQKSTCFHTFHRKPKHSKQPTTRKLSKADELAQHSHHHAALFPRVGEGGSAFENAVAFTIADVTATNVQIVNYRTSAGELVVDYQVVSSNATARATAWASMDFVGNWGFGASPARSSVWCSPAGASCFSEKHHFFDKMFFS